MLIAYQTALQALIQAPNAPTPLVPAAAQTNYINIARNQLAADAECIRATGTLTLTALRIDYPFSEIVTPTGFGYGPVISVRSGQVNQRTLEIRPYEWFQAYHLNHDAAATPSVMAQQGQGVFGKMIFSPPPIGSASLIVDCVLLPVALTTDATVEAIPDLWRDAVPFYAAWLAMQSLQRQDDAEAMYRRYAMLARRGREFATPSQLPGNMPGGVGTEMAAVHTVLSQPPQPSGQGGR